MSQATEDKVYGLIVQAQEMQKFCLEFKGSAEGVVRSLPDAARSAVRDAAREFITEGAEKASRGLLDASNEAKVTSAALRHTGLMQGLFLLAVALVIGGVGFAVMGFIAKSRLAELHELKAAIRQDQATLGELQSKTWGLELGTDGKTRWITLPKGVTFGKIGDTKDGRKAVFIQ